MDRAILGVTPALTALMSPFWGRLADRYGRKIMVARSLVACAVVMAAMAFVTRPWHVFALRAALGLLTGYGGLTLAMAAESAPRDRMAAAIGTVQTAQRLGPAVGPGHRWSAGRRSSAAPRISRHRRALYVSPCCSCSCCTRSERARTRRSRPDTAPARISFRKVLAFENFLLLMGVIFGIQFVDRSFGPILPLYLEQLGVARPSRAGYRRPAVFGDCADRRGRASFLRPAVDAILGHASSSARRRLGRRPARRCSASAGGFWLMMAAMHSSARSAPPGPPRTRRPARDSSRRARHRVSAC